MGNLGSLKNQVLKLYSKRLGINVLEVRGRKNLELALKNKLRRNLDTCVVEKENFAVADVEQSENGKQSVASQSDNASDIAIAIPLDTFVT